MINEHKLHIRWLGISTLIGLVLGLVFGYLYNDYVKSLIISFSISYTIWALNYLLHVFFLYKIKDYPREKKLLIEIPSFFGTSVLGFFIVMSVFSRVFGFDLFVNRFLFTNLGLLLILYVLLSGLIYAFHFYRELKEKEVVEEKLRMLAAEVELKALKAQMNPHFLFNALNSISALVTQDAKLARQMIASLSELLRVSLENRDKMLVPLKEELDFARLYLGIEQIRFGDRMEVHEEIDSELLNMPFPALVLQPLLENAIKHGVAKRRGKGDIRLGIKRRNNHIECFVLNSVAKNRFKGQKRTTTNGTGLQNIRQRLDLLYEDKYDFKAGYSDSGDFKVQLLLPVVTDGKD